MALPHLSRLNVLVLTIIATAWSTFVLPLAPANGQGVASNVTFDTVIEVKGTLKSAQRNSIILTREDGEDVTVMLHEDPTMLKFIAEAKPAFLRPQMLVRVTANLGPGAMPTAPVDRVEIFQPIQAARLPNSVKQNYTVGIHSADHAKPNPQQGFIPGKYTIVGMIAGMDPAGIYISTGGRARIPIPLVQDAKIALLYNNLSLAQPGDPVSVKGFHQPPDETKVIGADISIRPERIFGEAVDNGDQRSPRTRRGRARPADQPDATQPGLAQPGLAQPADDQ
jgi:hypothetical protein